MCAPRGVGGGADGVEALEAVVRAAADGHLDARECKAGSTAAHAHLVRVGPRDEAVGVDARGLAALRVEHCERLIRRRVRRGHLVQRRCVRDKVLHLGAVIRQARTRSGRGVRVERGGGWCGA